MIRVLLVDDHTIFLEGLHALLSSQDDIEVVATAQSGLEVLDVLKVHAVDVILTDINMPGMDGLELTKRVKKTYPHIQIMGLSMHKEEKVIRKMLKNGALGYILKNAEKDEMLEGIRSIYANEVYLDKKTYQVIIKGATGQVQRTHQTGSRSIPSLSKREQEVLSLIAEGLTTQQIADTIFVSANTVMTYRKNLFSKLDVPNMAALIKKAVEKGLV
jgi:DNA-binding NarL/FixJ family response regulator